MEPQENKSILPRLEEPCDRCKGKGLVPWDDSPCSGCGGSGYIPTEAGAQIIDLLRRHFHFEAASE
jgi:DnaJ-class molecular chaperone